MNFDVLIDIYEIVETRGAINSTLRRAVHLIGQYCAIIDSIKADTERRQKAADILEASGAENTLIALNEDIAALEALAIKINEII